MQGFVCAFFTWGPDGNKLGIAGGAPMHYSHYGLIKKCCELCRCLLTGVLQDPSQHTDVRRMGWDGEMICICVTSFTMPQIFTGGLRGGQPWLNGRSSINSPQRLARTRAMIIMWSMYSYEAIFPCEHWVQANSTHCTFDSMLFQPLHSVDLYSGTKTHQRLPRD